MSDIAEIKATLASHGATLASHGEQLASIKATLARLEPLLTRVLETQAEMRGELRGQLDQMGQRISDVNARIPLAVGYTPPVDRKRA